MASVMARHVQHQATARQVIRALAASVSRAPTLMMVPQIRMVPAAQHGTLETVRLVVITTNVTGP